MSLDRYCSACAAALPHGAPVTCPACGAQHWRDPKPCAGALVERDGKVLFVRRAREPWKGYWDVTGGYCECNEHPAETAIREAREEVGLEVEITGYLGAWPDVYGPPGSEGAQKATLNLYYLARPVGGTEGTGDPSETLEIAWFGPEEIPEQLAFPVHIRPVIDAWRRVIASRMPLQPLLDFDATRRAGLQG
jgi:ADP-ribose pyrophosphatase YjhB (NUDIX family)